MHMSKRGAAGSWCGCARTAMGWHVVACSLGAVPVADREGTLCPAEPAVMPCLCLQCQIIYPRQQLLTLRELEMIGFIENNVSKLSLLLSEISRCELTPLHQEKCLCCGDGWGVAGCSSLRWQFAVQGQGVES